jgi:hypothetical protein
MGLTEMADNLGRNLSGQLNPSSDSTKNKRIIYPAKVRDVEDFANQGRIKVEIISINETTGEEQPGKDNNTPLSKLPLCLPLLPDFLHSAPQLGEMVFIILDNPSDLSSNRYWVGPIRSTRFPRETESYVSANQIYQNSSYKTQGNSTVKNSENPIFPSRNDIYIKGKDDSDIIFKSREVVLRAGSFINGQDEENKITPCSIQLLQKDVNNNENISPYSQINIKASNINLISTDLSSRKNRTLNENGSLRDENNIEKNTNKRLEDFGEDAVKLHPLVLGDELVKLLKVIIRFCINHKHTPQESAYAPTEELDILNEFLSDENMKVILSNTVRTN